MPAGTQELSMDWPGDLKSDPPIFQDWRSPVEQNPQMLEFQQFTALSVSRRAENVLLPYVLLLAFVTCLHLLGLKNFLWVSGVA